MHCRLETINKMLGYDILWLFGYLCWGSWDALHLHFVQLGLILSHLNNLLSIKGRWQHVPIVCWLIDTWYLWIQYRFAAGFLREEDKCCTLRCNAPKHYQNPRRNWSSIDLWTKGTVQIDFWALYWWIFLVCTLMDFDLHSHVSGTKFVITLSWLCTSVGCWLLLSRSVHPLRFDTSCDPNLMNMALPQMACQWTCCSLNFPFCVKSSQMSTEHSQINMVVWIGFTSLYGEMDLLWQLIQAFFL